MRLRLSAHANAGCAGTLNAIFELVPMLSPVVVDPSSSSGRSLYFIGATETFPVLSYRAYHDRKVWKLSHMTLSTELRRIPGVGNARLKRLREAGIVNIRDLHEGYKVAAAARDGGEKNKEEEEEDEEEASSPTTADKRRKRVRRRASGASTSSGQKRPCDIIEVEAQRLKKFVDAALHNEEERNRNMHAMMLAATRSPSQQQQQQQQQQQGVVLGGGGGSSVRFDGTGAGAAAVATSLHSMPSLPPLDDVLSDDAVLDRIISRPGGANNNDDLDLDLDLDDWTMFMRDMLKDS